MKEEVGKTASSAKRRVCSHHSQIIRIRKGLRTLIAWQITMLSPCRACNWDALNKFYGKRNHAGSYQSKQFKLTRFSPPAPAETEEAPSYLPRAYIIYF